jgi:predicted Mrr-cat superfamily restriction endonuclease
VPDVLWGLHHDGPRPLVEEGVIAIGWPSAGDLDELPDEREAFKDHLRFAYPHKTEPWIANAAGQLLRFRHTMQPGDLVVYPRASDRTIHIGEITGGYWYDTTTWPRYPMEREVDWLVTGLPRERFSGSCLYELGCSLTVFRVRRHRDELFAAVTAAYSTSQPK